MPTGKEGEMLLGHNEPVYKNLCETLGIGEPTLNDIVAELCKYRLPPHSWLYAAAARTV